MDNWDMNIIGTIPGILKKKGYKTGLIGKLHVASKSNLEFDFRVNAKDIMGNRDAKRIAEYAGDFFNLDKEKPFFLLVGYSDPHREDQGPTDMKNFENFSGFANDKVYRGVTPTKYKPADVHVPEFLPDIPEVREELADQYESVSRLDTGIGWVLENLQKSGRYDETLIIYISDNGIPFPGAKTTVYDSGTRVPMIVGSPEITKGGVVNTAMVSFVDLMPTILDWTETKLPRYTLPGKSFRAILNNAADPTRSEVYASHTFHEVTMFYPMRSIRTRKYRYILNLYPELEFPFATDLFVSRTWQGILKRKLGVMGKRSTNAYLYRPKEELYDIENDPVESVNLAGDARYSGVLQELRNKLNDMRNMTDDPWLINDHYSVNSKLFRRH
jgi:N-sulfoglucosamine sulfohydrolase